MSTKIILDYVEWKFDINQLRPDLIHNSYEDILIFLDEINKKIRPFKGYFGNRFKTCEARCCFITALLISMITLIGIFPFFIWLCVTNKERKIRETQMIKVIQDVLDNRRVKFSNLGFRVTLTKEPLYQDNTIKDIFLYLKFSFFNNLTLNTRLPLTTENQNLISSLNVNKSDEIIDDKIKCKGNL